MIQSHPESAPGYAGDAVAWAMSHADKGDAHSRRHMRRFAMEAKRRHEVVVESIVEDAFRAEFNEAFARSIELLDEAISIFDGADARDGVDTRESLPVWSRASGDRIQLEVPGRGIYVDVQRLRVTGVQKIDARTEKGRVLDSDVLLRAHAGEPDLYLVSGTTDELNDLVAKPGHGYLRALRGAPRREDWKRGENHRPLHMVIETGPHWRGRDEKEIVRAWPTKQEAVPHEFL